MPIIKKTLSKLVCPDDESMVNDSMNESVNKSLDSNECLFNMEEKDKYMFFIQYSGKATEKLAYSFKRLNAPCQVIMTTRKAKTVMPISSVPVTVMC